jgi:hypothetical protein
MNSSLSEVADLIGVVLYLCGTGAGTSQDIVRIFFSSSGSAGDNNIHHR